MVHNHIPVSDSPLRRHGSPVTERLSYIQFPTQWMLMRHDLLSEVLQYIWVLLPDSKVTHLCVDCEGNLAFKSTVCNSQWFNRAHHMNYIHTSGLISSSSSSRRWTSFSGWKFWPFHRPLSISLDPGRRLSSF